MAVGWPPAEAGDWGAERAHLARAVQGPTDSTCRPAARIAGSPNFGLLTEETAGRKLAESAELLLASPNWGRFIAMSAYRGGMPTAGFTRMLDPAAVPVIFACWAARFVAARGTGRALRTGALREKPAGRAGLGFLP